MNITCSSVNFSLPIDVSTLCSSSTLKYPSTGGTNREEINN